MFSLSDLKLGKVVTLNNEPYQIVFTQHIKQARGGAVLKTKLKNLISGSTLEKTFSGADAVEEADMARRQANFLYQQEGNFFFMDNTDFEQFQFSSDDLGAVTKYLKDGQEVEVLFFNNRPVSIVLPTKIVFAVTSAPEGVRGNSAGAVTKTVALENGLEVRTPLFIKSGDNIIVNTDTGEYVSRA